MELDGKAGEQEEEKMTYMECADLMGDEVEPTLGWSDEIREEESVTLSSGEQNEGRQKVVVIGTWNVNGLKEYKHNDLLAASSQVDLSVLGVCETHLVTSEQCVQWERHVDSDGRFIWFGRCARPARRNNRGRASGGIGMLIRMDWAPYAQVMPACQHDCLMFVRVEPPDAPYVFYFGVAYRSPIGGTREDDNPALMEEVQARVNQYRTHGLVCVMGDFNIHIGDRPSTLICCDLSESGHMSGPVRDWIGGGPVELIRRSVDYIGTNDVGEVSNAAVEFVDHMDNAGLVILNGLIDVGDGTEAQATYGDSSVIDLILVDSDHWSSMLSVSIATDASAMVESDHHLILSGVRYAVEVRQESSDPPSKVDGENASSLVSDTRYRVRAGADKCHFDPFKMACDRELGALLSRWRRDIDIDRLGGDPSVSIGIEECWHEFLSTVELAAAQSIGIRDSTHRPHRSAYRKCRDNDWQLKQWKWRRLRIMREKPLVRLSNPVRWAQLEAEQKLLNGRIRHHIRKAIHERENTEIDALRLLSPGQMREHWAALKRVGHMHPKPHSIPMSAVDRSGSSHHDIPGVRSVWHDTWARMAEHKPEDGRYDTIHREEVELTVGQHERIERSTPGLGALTSAQTSANECLNVDIELSEVVSSVRRLLNGKSPGCDGIASEILKNGGSAMHRCLHSLCSMMFNSGRVPLDWLRGVVVPLHKDGDKSDPLNYRPITLLSIAGKVYTGLLHSRLMGWCESHGIIVPEQGGFRPGRGCPEQLFTLTELIKLRRMRRQYTYTCFIDIRKAYDTVWHDGLKAKLIAIGINGRMYRAIASFYNGGESTVKLGGSLGYTDFFPIETGVRQGCILSPLLYSIFINDLARELKGMAIGAGIDQAGETTLTVLLYADDIVLLADTLPDLSSLMHRVHCYSHRWRFEVNHSKCGLMRFNPDGSSRQPTDRITIGEVEVPWVTIYKYLGVELHNGRPFTHYRKRALASATRAGYRVSGMGLYSGKLSVPLGSQVYRALVRPLLEYAAEVVSIHPWPQAELTQLTMAKRVLGCSTRMATAAVMGELQWPTMEARYQQMRVSFWGKIQLAPIDSPVRQVYDESMRFNAGSAAGDEGIPSVSASDGWDVCRPIGATSGSHLSLWCQQLKMDLYQLGLRHYWERPSMVGSGHRVRDGQTDLDGGNEDSEADREPPTPADAHDRWKEQVKRLVTQRDRRRWQIEVERLTSLSVYRLAFGMDRSDFGLANYLTVRHGGWNDLRLIGRQLLTRLRCGRSELRISTGRYDGTPRDERFCSFCTMGAIEDEEHFMMECELYGEGRQQLWRDLQSMVGRSVDLTSLPDSVRFSILLDGRDASCYFASVGGHLYHRCMSRILIELGRWSLRRKEFVRSEERARQEYDTHQHHQHAAAEGERETRDTDDDTDTDTNETTSTIRTDRER